MLNDATEKVKEKSCYALEAFCENLGEDIVPFLQPLVTRLMEMLRGSSRKTQEMSISALASVAMAAQDKFIPYFEPLYSLIRVLLHTTAESDLSLRARAMEWLGLANLAVGRAVCEPVIAECTACALAGLELEDAEQLREYTYGFFAQLADLIKAEIAPVLPTLVPRMLKSLENEDIIAGMGDEGGGGLKAIAAALSRAPAGGEDGDPADADESGDESGDEENGGHSLSIRTALLDEKASAANAIGECAKHAGAAYAPYVEKSLEALLNAAEYFHEDVRGSVARSLAQLLVPCKEAEGVAPWTKGEMSSVSSLPPGTRRLLEQVLPVLMHTFESDDDKDVVASASESLADVATLLGPAGISAVAPSLAQTALSLLSKRHPCMLEEEEYEAGLEEEEDHDAGLWEAVSELLISLPRVLGDQWLLHFTKLVPTLLPYLGAEHPSSDRALAIGVLAESLHQLEACGAGFFVTMLPHAIRCATDEDVTTRQNGTFCLGVLGQYGGVGALPHVQQILTALQPRLGPDEDSSVRDNALGALSRLVLGFGAQLPVDQMLPAIVAALPLRADAGENLPAVRALSACLRDEACRPHLAPAHLPQMLGAFAAMLGPDLKLDEKPRATLQAEVKATLTWMLQLAPDLRAHLPADLVL